MIEIKAPASKSYAQRAIVCATLATGQSVVRAAGSSDDVIAAIGACRSLGAKIDKDGDDLLITSDGTLRPGRIEIGESGLLTRLIAPIAAMSGGRCEIVGRATINSRPMHSLLAVLRQLGAAVESKNDCLPLTITAAGSPAPTIEIDGSDGSQVLSGLLMTLPLLKNNTLLKVNNLRSQPYVEMTIATLQDFGIETELSDFCEFRIKGNQHYKPTTYAVEGDWSSASYFLVANAIAGGGKISVTGLCDQSIQADCAIADVLRQAKDLQGFTFDATHCPDLFPALVALASHCKGQSRIVGTSRLAHKESARDVVLRDEWSKFGIEIDLATPDTMTINGNPHHIAQHATIDPHGDHRIAMAAAIMGRGVDIQNDQVVSKSYPEFWTDYQRIEHLLNQIRK